MTGHLRAAFLSATTGLVAGVAVHAGLYALTGMVSPGFAGASPARFIVGPILLFESGLVYGLLGGALFVLPAPPPRAPRAPAPCGGRLSDASPAPRRPVSRPVS